MQNTIQVPRTGYLRLAQLIGKQDDSSTPIIPVSAGTIWNWTRDGKFPQPVKLGPRVTAWKAEDIQKFLNDGGFQV